MSKQHVVWMSSREDESGLVDAIQDHQKSPPKQSEGAQMKPFGPQRRNLSSYGKEGRDESESRDPYIDTEMEAE